MEKIQRICSLVLLAAFWGCVPVLHAQSFDKLWKQVEQAQEKSLPQTVIKLTDEIFRNAKRIPRRCLKPICAGIRIRIY